GHRGDVRHADNFAHGSDTNPIGFVSDAEADDLEIFLHEVLSGSGTSDFGVFELVRFGRRTGAARSGGVAASRGGGAARVKLALLVDDKTIHVVEQVARKLEHLLRGSGKLGGTGSGLLHEIAHLLHGADDGLSAGSLFFDGGVDLLRDFSEAVGGFGDLRRANGLLVGGGADFLGELVDFRDHVGNFVESGAQVVAEAETFLDDAGAVLHIFDGLARFALDALDEVGDFLGGLGGLFGELADFVRDDSETETVLTGARGFDGGVEGEQVGLLGEVINDFNDLADVIGAMAENIDDFGGGLNGAVGAVQAIGSFLHSLDAGDDLLAGAVGDVQQDLGGIGDALNGGDHLIDGSGSFGDAGSLHLSVLDDVLH